MSVSHGLGFEILHNNSLVITDQYDINNTYLTQQKANLLTFGYLRLYSINPTNIGSILKLFMTNVSPKGVVNT